MSYSYFYNHSLPSLIRQIRKIKRFREPKFYAVAVGRRIGIYRTWPSCKVQIDNIANAKFQKFDTHLEALEYLKETPKEAPIPVQNLTKLTEELLNQNEESSNNIVFVDGSCWNNGMPNACAGVGIYWPNSPEHNQSLTIDGRQTSIRAEIWAAIFALRQAKQLGLKKVTIYTDSHFVIQSATKWLYKWKQNNWTTSNGTEVKNRYDMMALDEAVRDMEKVIWRPVAAHSGVHGNEEADKLANSAIADTLTEQHDPEIAATEALVQKNQT